MRNNNIKWFINFKEVGEGYWGVVVRECYVIEINGRGYFKKEGIISFVKSYWEVNIDEIEYFL